MQINYNRLWKILIDKGMMKKDLRLAIGMTTTALAKMGRNENVSTEVLVKICEKLNCRLEDICEVVPAPNEGEMNNGPSNI
jgi:DNA-binding Xre family transcriptional regulator